MNKINMTNAIVEIDGDEMTRIIWKSIKEKLIIPFVCLKTEYYDLSLQNRDKTNDEITIKSAESTLKHGVAVKCATITPNEQRLKEYNLKRMWKSPNGTIRAMLDGTVFREPIIVKGIKACIPTWTKPIIIARHAFGDVYKNTEMNIEGNGEAVLSFVTKNGEQKQSIFKFNGKGVLQGMFNTNESILSFAHACFKYALSIKKDLWFSAKDTISKIYDHRFKEIFENLYINEYKKEFERHNISYFYTLIDDAVARAIKSDGGFVWALKNYDGDVMSDMVATAFGSLAMMTSVLVSPKGVFEYEAAHGTVTRHYYKYLNGEQTSTNPIATIFAWSGALKKRGERDNLIELVEFANKLELASLNTIESGYMTKDLSLIYKGDAKELNTDDFINKIAENLMNLF